MTPIEGCHGATLDVDGSGLAHQAGPPKGQVVCANKKRQVEKAKVHPIPDQTCPVIGV